MACQDAMWSRAVAADAPAPEEASSGTSATQPEPGKEQFVQEFSAEGPVRVQSQQAALHALSEERARQYKVMCEQVGTSNCAFTSCIDLSYGMGVNSTGVVLLAALQHNSVALRLPLSVQI